MNYCIQEIKKLIRIFLSDPKPLAAGIIAPSLILIAFSFIFGNFTSLPISIVNHDKGEMGIILEGTILSQISPLGGKPYFTNVPLTTEEAEAALKENRISGYIIIPGDFTEKVTMHRYPVITYGLNNYNSDFGKNMRLYLDEGILKFYQEVDKDLDISMEKIFSSHIQVEWVLIIATGSILLATIIGGMFFFLFIYFKEVDYNTFVFYRITPLHYFKVHGVKMAMAWIFSLLTGCINIALAWALTGLNLFVHYPFIVIILSIVSIIYIGLCSILCLFLKQFFSSALVSMFGCVLIWFISGGMAAGFPQTLSLTSVISRVFPNTYALELLRTRVFGTHSPHTLSYWGILICMFILCTGASFVFSSQRIWKNR